MSRDKCAQLSEQECLDQPLPVRILSAIRAGDEVG